MNSKFDRDSKDISAVWIWNKLKLRGSSRGRNISKELLGYMDGSFKTVCRRLADIIEEKGGRILCGKEVTGIAPGCNGMLDVHTGDGCESYDRVIVTTAPGILGKAAAQRLPKYSKALENIKYKANLCMVIEMTQQLSPYYWITIAEIGRASCRERV